jgi:gluconate 5-dehydrogenase
MRGLEIFSLKGRVALVTGSSKGLGWAMAQALASAGAHVVLNSRDPDALATRETDLTACFYLAKEASRPMVRAGWGRIINISSVMGKIARPSIAPYVAAKAGVHGLTRALAVELGPRGVNVNCIGPGFYPASQNEVVRRDKTFYDWVSNRAPLGRWGDPAELGGAVIYFASDASSFCNGQVLMVDGGMTFAL